MPATAMPDTASLDAATTHTCDSLKAELRRWELAFAAEHGRKPQKADIDREPDIARLYKAYRDLKRRPQPSKDSKEGDTQNRKPAAANASAGIGATASATLKSPSCKRVRNEGSVAAASQSSVTPKRKATAARFAHLLSPTVGTGNGTLQPDDEVLDATPLAAEKMRKRTKLFDGSHAVTDIDYDAGWGVGDASTKAAATTALPKLKKGKERSFVARVRNAFTTTTTGDKTRSNTPSANTSGRTTPSHWSARAPSAGQPAPGHHATNSHPHPSDFPTMEMRSTANFQLSLGQQSSVPMPSVTSAVESATLSATTTAKAGTAVAGLRKLASSLLPSRKFTFRKQKSGHAGATSDAFMSPPARKMLTEHAVMAPGSARKVQALLFSPAAKGKKQNGTESVVHEEAEEQLGGNGIGDDLKPEVQKTTDATEDFSHKQDDDATTAPTDKKEPCNNGAPVNSDDEAIEGNDGEHVDDDNGKRTWKKKPINGKRYTSKRKLRPVDLKEGIHNYKARRGPMSHSAPLKLNRRGKGNKLKAINHAAVDNSGPMFKDYSSAKLLAGEPEETNPFDQEDVADQSGDDDAADDGEQLHEDEDERLDNDDHELLDKAQTDASGTAASNDIDLEAMLQDSFKLQAFRPGQRECIERIIDGKSTVLVQPTGMGKSLCFQMPTLVLTKERHAICLVVSPTISLMEDQVRGLPACIKGACWNSNQTPAENYKLLERIKNGHIQMLFVSPEKLTGISFVETFRSPDMPRIAFACIDEVHCLSEWSHNFRPSYFQVRAVLTGDLGVACILGLTATATQLALQSVCSMLRLDPVHDVIRTNAIPKNLILSVSKDGNRKKALFELLSREPYCDLHGIIVYCLRQADADEVARYLRTVGSRQVESYHAGKEAKERTRIQEAFFSGKLSILCATIAFGLGINKADVRAVIHYSLPKSLENYVQEIGRAGRDGKLSYCHLFVNTDDFHRLRSLAHTDSADSVVIKKFLDRVLSADVKPKKKGKGAASAATATLRGLDVVELEPEFDMRKSVMTTIMSYLTLLEDPPINLLPNIPTGYRLIFYKVKPEDLALADSVIGRLERHAKKSTGHANIWSIDTMDACEKLSMTPAELNVHLYGLQSERKLTVKTEGESFQYELLLTAEQYAARFFDIWRQISQRVERLERLSIKKVEQVFALMESSATENIYQDDEIAIAGMRQIITEYFDQAEKETKDVCELEDADKDALEEVIKNNALISKPNLVKEGLVKKDLRAFIDDNEVMSGRSVAKIFHALPTPKCPYAIWARTTFWGRHIDFDFDRIVELHRELHQ